MNTTDIIPLAQKDRSLLEVSVASHIYTPIDTQTIMRDVLIALILPGVSSIFFFGFDSFLIIFTSCLTCLITEWGFQKLAHKEVRIGDFSALVTGVLLAYCLPSEIPLWTIILGSAFSIIIGKELFGGLGYNLFNPALVGRAFLLASWPAHMASWKQPIGKILKSSDAITSATPLEQWKTSNISTPYGYLFLGQISGCIGETSAISLSIGACYLFYRQIIDWRISFSYLGTVIWTLDKFLGYPIKSISYPYTIQLLICNDFK